ncbi:hypothetical protein AX17_000720 [Amanita inopinata Kibby_2008]|nr:hypothetical protein AX17_000720 [Amanita inopinata Kibby_2008]
MTEYDYSPEAFERHMSTQRRIARWVDQTERHRPEFGTRNDVTPPARQTAYAAADDSYVASRSSRRSSRDRPPTAHQRHSSSTYPAYRYPSHYATPSVSPPAYPYHPPNSAGVLFPAPVPISSGYTSFPQAVPPPPVVIVSPAQSNKSQKSRRSHKSQRPQTYIVAPPPPPPPVTSSGLYLQYPYGTRPATYAYMAPTGQQAVMVSSRPFY